MYHVAGKSGEDSCSALVDEKVAHVLKHAFPSPGRNGRPQPVMWAPAPGHPFAKKDKPVGFRMGPSLLLDNLPEKDELGRTHARELLQENSEWHTSRGGQHQVQRRVTSLIGPSAAGKTRTAYEALCHEYGFCFGFSTEKDPGTYVLRKALSRFSYRLWDQREAAERNSSLPQFRDNLLRDLHKLITRILLAFALGLLEYLDQHKDQANPKGFLLFQLNGASGVEVRGPRMLNVGAGPDRSTGVQLAYASVTVVLSFFGAPSLLQLDRATILKPLPQLPVGFPASSSASVLPLRTGC